VYRRLGETKEHCKSRGSYFFFYGKGSKNHQLGTGFFVHRIVAAVERLDFVSNRMSYIYVVLKGHWCNIILLNAPTEEKSDGSNDRYHEELKQVFYHFPKYHMIILLGDCNAKLVRGDIIKPTTGNERMHQDTKHTGVRIQKFGC